MCFSKPFRPLGTAIAAGLLGAGLIPAQPAADTFDIDFSRCGDLACAYVYQGEGVNHPQLITHVRRKNGNLNTIDFTYIYDYAPNSELTISFYIESDLAQRLGGAYGVSPTASDLETMLAEGPIIEEGIMLALTSPYTAHLDLWPQVDELTELVLDSAEQVPNSLWEWDVQNGTLDPGVPLPGEDDVPTPSASDTMVFGNLCTLNPDLCMDSGASGNAASTTLATQATAIPQQVQRHFERQKRRFARISQNTGSAMDTLTSSGSVATPNLVCSKENLRSEPTLGECEARCDECDKLWEAQIDLNHTIACGGALALAGHAAAPKSFGISELVVGALAALGAAQTCGALAVRMTTIQRVAMLRGCKHYCNVYWSTSSD